MKIIIKMVLLVGILCFGMILPSYAELAINLVAVNGTGEVKDIEVKSYLPKELEPSDILDSGELTVQYDVDKGAYYVSGKVSFQPKESKTFKIKVADVWRIRPEEIEILRNQVDENLALMEGQENYSAAQDVRNKLVERLDYIYGQQETYSQDIERRIEQYRAYFTQLEQVRKNIYAFDHLLLESPHTDELEAPKTVKFMLEVKNPSDTQEKELQQKHLLPKEIRAEDIVDNQGFDIRYDEKKGAAFLSRKDNFKPGEVKKYEIVIKDVWFFPSYKIDLLQTRAATAFEEIKGSMYEASGNFLNDEVSRKIAQIKESQLLELSIKEHIGLYRVNTKRFSDTEDLVDRMEHLLAIVRAKRLEDMEKGKVQNVLQKLKALKGLADLSEALFKKRLTMTTVWRIIFITLGFVAFFTTINFTVWIRRSKSMGEEIAGKEPIKEVPKPGAAPAEEKT